MKCLSAKATLLALILIALFAVTPAASAQLAPPCTQQVGPVIVGTDTDPLSPGACAGAAVSVGATGTIAFAAAGVSVEEPAPQFVGTEVRSGSATCTATQCVTTGIGVSFPPTSGSASVCLVGDVNLCLPGPR
jgi:hypothetical protein